MTDTIENQTRCEKCFAPAVGGVSPHGYCAEHAPASPGPERGKVYDSMGPNGEKLVIMTNDTWTDFGTNMQSLRQAVSHLSRKLKEAEISEKVLLARLADRETRLENLRAVRRAEKRPEVEALIVPSTESTLKSTEG
jgi:hypothetical protein